MESLAYENAENQHPGLTVRPKIIHYSVWTDSVRLNVFFSKNRMHRILELELEQTNSDVQCSNEITITITNMGRKFRERAGSPSNTKSPGLRPSFIPSGIFIHAVIWPQQIWAGNWVGAAPLWGRGAGSPSSTFWPVSRPTCVPSFILIRPTVLPQRTNVTDRTDRQTDSGLIA